MTKCITGGYVRKDGDPSFLWHKTKPQETRLVGIEYNPDDDFDG